MSDWQNNKKWSDIYIPTIKCILGQYFIKTPRIEEDIFRNTDLMTFNMASVRIACRIRRPEYYKYNDEFTIRQELPSGIKTELDKILEGYGDYLFYGIAGENKHLWSWGLGDLKVFRLWFTQKLEQGILPGIKKYNTDNSSNFLVFKWKEVTDGFVVMSHNIKM